MTDHITIPRALAESWLNTICYAQRSMGYDSILERAIVEIRAELAKPVESSYTAVQLAATVLSDCGISTNHTALHERVAKRITRYEEQLIDNLQKLPKPVTDVVVTKNKSGQIVAVTLQDEDGRVMEVIDKSTPTPAWHDAPTCGGLWLCNEGDDNPYRWTTHRVTFPLNQLLVGEDERWFGPIPQDEEKS